MTESLYIRDLDITIKFTFSNNVNYVKDADIIEVNRDLFKNDYRIVVNEQRDVLALVVNPPEKFQHFMTSDSNVYIYIKRKDNWVITRRILLSRYVKIKSSSISLSMDNIGKVIAVGVPKSLDKDNKESGVVIVQQRSEVGLKKATIIYQPKRGRDDIFGKRVQVTHNGTRLRVYGDKLIYNYELIGDDWICVSIYRNLPPEILTSDRNEAWSII